MEQDINFQIVRNALLDLMDGINEVRDIVYMTGISEERADEILDIVKLCRLNVRNSKE